MREEDTHGSWKRLYLKLAAPLREERERERERFTSGKLSSVASLDSGCNSG